MSSGYTPKYTKLCPLTPIVLLVYTPSTQNSPSLTGAILRELFGRGVHQQVMLRVRYR